MEHKKPGPDYQNYGAHRRWHALRDEDAPKTLTESREFFEKARDHKLTPREVAQFNRGWSIGAVTEGIERLKEVIRHLKTDELERLGNELQTLVDTWDKQAFGDGDDSIA